MRTFILILALLIYFPFSSNAQFNGKPLYDVLVRQYPDTFGTFRMELYPTVAPLHCENFDTLARQGFYDSLAFHRVVPNFVIQGGDPNSKTGPPSTWGQGAPWQQTVPAEFNPISHSRSIIGAARGTDINSATSQFYVNLANNSNLNGNYTAYGKVISGMNVVDSVEAVPRNANDLPLDKVDMFITYVGTDTSAPAMAPNLLSPADSAVDLFGNENFSWSSVNANDFILYRIEFSKQPNFSTIDYYRDIGRNTTNITPLSNLEQGFVTYYWRVLTNNGGRLTASQPRSFTTYIEAPLLNAPIDGQSGTYTNPIFKWTSVTGADQYNLVISTLPGLEVPNFRVIDTTTWKTDLAPNALDANTTYYWGVRSVKNGMPGAFSETRSFTTGSIFSGIESMQNALMLVYPNPNNGHFRIELQQNNSSLNTLKIMDLSGKIILRNQFRTNSLEVEMSDYPNGMYLYEVEAGSEFYKGKIWIK